MTPVRIQLVIQDDEGNRTEVPFVRDEIVIGRMEGCTIRLTERNISRRHARLVREGDGLLVEDTGSYNGILLNGIRLEKPTRLFDGDLLEIGDYRMIIRFLPIAATSPPPPSVERPPQPAEPAPPGPVADGNVLTIERKEPAIDDLCLREGGLPAGDSVKAQPAAVEPLPKAEVESLPTAISREARSRLPLAAGAVAVMLLALLAWQFGLRDRQPAGGPPGEVDAPGETVIASAASPPPPAASYSPPASVAAPAAALPPPPPVRPVAPDTVPALAVSPAATRVDAAQTAVGTGPALAREMISEGRRALNRGDLETAERRLVQAAGLDPDNPEARRLLALVRRQSRNSSGDAGEGGSVGTDEEPPAAPVETPVRQGPSPARAAYLDGNRLLQQRRLVEAVDAYRRAIALDRSFGYAYRGLAVCYATLGKPGIAVENYKKYIELMPTAPDGAQVRKIIEDYYQSRQP